MVKRRDYEQLLLNAILAFIVAFAIAAIMLLLMGIQLHSCNPFILCGAVGFMAVILWLASVLR